MRLRYYKIQPVHLQKQNFNLILNIIMKQRLKEPSLNLEKQDKKPQSKQVPKVQSTPRKQKNLEHFSTEKSDKKFMTYLLDGPPLNLMMQQKNKFNGCNCRKSQCLKMYCICFSSGKMCDQSCLCDSCRNKTDNLMRADAINQIISKDPFAFSRGDVNVPQSSGQGCNCKKSNCSKKYCACFSKGRKCGQECKCLNCENPMKENPIKVSDDQLKKKMKIQ